MSGILLCYELDHFLGPVFDNERYFLLTGGSNLYVSSCYHIPECNGYIHRYRRWTDKEEFSQYYI